MFWLSVLLTLFVFVTYVDFEYDKCRSMSSPARRHADRVWLFVIFFLFVAAVMHVPVLHVAIRGMSDSSIMSWTATVTVYAVLLVAVHRAYDFLHWKVWGMHLRDLAGAEE